VRSHWGWVVAAAVVIVLGAVSVAVATVGSTSTRTPASAQAGPTHGTTGAEEAAGTAGVTRTSRPNRKFTVSGPIVALGDSYTSGLLFPLAPASKPFGCLRSTASYPTLVAKALKASGELTDVACDSAGVGDMTGAESTPIGTNPPQFDALKADDSLVMLTLSGDDLGFTHVLDECMLLSVSDVKGSPCESHYTPGGTNQLAQLIVAEAPKMAGILSQIHAQAPHARVLLLGYPDLFPQTGGCWPVVPITDGDIAYLRATEMKLNAMLASVAGASGTTYVNTYDATIGHDFCQSRSVKDIEGLIPTSFAYSFHPNAHGQSVMATQVLAALRS
jgi:lysophospholipase L1-like esterase